MRRIQYHRYGGPDVLQLDTCAPLVPGPGQVCVQVKAAAVNQMDWKLRQGALRMMTGRQFPRGLGHDFAGIISAVGPGVTQLAPGDAVFSATGLKEAGAFADQVLADAGHVFPKPPELSYETAAALTVSGVTAWTALVDKAHLRAGQSVFIAGCLGAVGRAAVQIALMHGAVVTGSCSAGDLDQARALGVAKAIDYRNPDLAQFRHQFDVVLDTHGGLTLGQCSALLKRGGVALHPAAGLLKMLRCFLSRRHIWVIAAPKPEILNSVAEAAQQGKLVPQIGAVVPLSAAIPAIVALERTGLPKGRLVVVPDAAASLA